MRILADENVRPAHVSALDAAGHDVKRVIDLREKGITDEAVRETARESARVVLTYDRKDFVTSDDHAGVLIATESATPSEVRRSIERVEQVYPDLSGIVEFLSDWA